MYLIFVFNKTLIIFTVALNYLNSVDCSTVPLDEFSIQTSKYLKSSKLFFHIFLNLLIHSCIFCLYFVLLIPSPKLDLISSNRVYLNKYVTTHFWFTGPKGKNQMCWVHKKVIMNNINLVVFEFTICGVMNRPESQSDFKIVRLPSHWHEKVTLIPSPANMITNCRTGIVIFTNVMRVVTWKLDRFICYEFFDKTNFDLTIRWKLKIIFQLVVFGRPLAGLE